MSGTKKPSDPPTGTHKAPGPRPSPAESDPFAGEDPIDAVMPAAAPGSGGDDDFDALGFDTSFGLTPQAPPGATLSLSDSDETPAAGVFLGEDAQVLSAHAIGRALAEADGREEQHEPPDMAASAAVVARFNDDGQHEIVPNEEDERVTPLAVFFDEDGERLLGREARRMAASAPSRAIVDVKEMIADPFFRLSTGGADGEVDSRTVLGMVLERLFADVARHAGARPTHVALAAPAWFADTQRETPSRGRASPWWGSPTRRWPRRCPTRSACPT